MLNCVFNLMRSINSPGCTTFIFVSLAFFVWIILCNIILYLNIDNVNERSNHDIMFLSNRNKLRQPRQQHHVPPRIIYVSESLNRDQNIENEKYYNDHHPFRKKKKLQFLEPSVQQQHNDRWYEANRYSSYETDDCKYVSDWQKKEAMPTCNLIHEVGLVNPDIQYIDGGGFKDVWKPFGTNVSYVMKTTKSNSIDYNLEFLWSDRQDALIMDQNTASPYVLNMFGYCAFSNVVQSITDTLWDWVYSEDRKNATPLEMLRISYMVAQGVADMHLYENNRYPTNIHMDIKVEQFLETAPGVYSINDFNRGEFLTYAKNKEYNDGLEVCKFTVNGQPRETRMRSPEEYSSGLQDDKLDVFSLGSVFYQILTGHEPFHDVKPILNATKMIEHGIPVKLPDVTDPSLVAIIKAIQKCRAFKSWDRPNSRQVADFLHEALEEQEKNKQQMSSRTTVEILHDFLKESNTPNAPISESSSSE